MSDVHESRPWYKVRWQIWLLAIIAVPLFIFLCRLAFTVPEVSIATGPIGLHKTLKDRMVFVVNLEKSFHKRGWPASIDLEGEDGKVLKVYWEKLNLPFVRRLVKSPDIVADIRSLGFKKIVLRSDNEQWDIDMKN